MLAKGVQVEYSTTQYGFSTGLYRCSAIDACQGVGGARLEYSSVQVVWMLAKRVQVQ